LTGETLVVDGGQVIASPMSSEGGSSS
jgi:hypothetical protein